MNKTLDDQIYEIIKKAGIHFSSPDSWSKAAVQSEVDKLIDLMNQRTKEVVEGERRNFFKVVSGFTASLKNPKTQEERWHNNGRRLLAHMLIKHLGDDESVLNEAEQRLRARTLLGGKDGK